MRHRDLLPLFALVAGWLAAMALVIVLVLDGRETTLERGMRATAALAEVMEQHTARTFQSAQLVVRGVSDGWWLVRPRRHDPAFEALLRQRLADLPQAIALFGLGADGRVLNETNVPHTSAEESFADRSYFQAYRADPQLESGVFGPYAGRRRDVDWFVAVTARLGPPGEFHGVVGAVVPRAPFERLYARMASAQGDVIALFHRDGTLIARYPAAGADAGRSFARYRLFAERVPSADMATYRGETQLFPGRRIVSYRAVEGLPLVVYVSSREDEVLAEWRDNAIGAAVAMGALTLLLAGVLARELRRRRRREHERVQRAQAEKLEALGQLTGGIAHDFGNLLNVLSNSLYLIGAGKDAAASAEALGMARRAVARGREMTDRLLTFARRQPLEVRAADLNSLVTQAHPLVAQAVGAKVELVLQLAPDLPPVLTDESQFEMALLNLVVNARDALDGRGRIVVRTYGDGPGFAWLAVEDEGPGMTEAVRRRAVEPFFTTKGKAGTGLGLAQVYGFMEQIGGALDIDSAPGKGTCVRLRFRAAPRQKHLV